MKTIILLGLLGLALPGEALTTSHKRHAEKLIKSSLKSDFGYRTIESLTTEIGPRKAGTPQEARARQWAVKAMKSIGLRRVRIQEFKVDHWVRKSESAEIVSPYPQKLRITTLGGSVGTPKEGLKGQIVRFESLQDLEKAKPGSLKSKIAFVDEGMTRTQDGSGYGVAVKKRSGAPNIAAKKGAIAAMIRSVGTQQRRFPHTGQMYYEDKTKKIPVVALSPPDADQLKRALKRGKVEVSLKLNIENKGPVNSGNVIGEIRGRSDQIVLIGAHLDSWDLGTGAVDDGAGVGIVLGAAKAIIDSGHRPKHTIRVVLFGSEEVGLVGAKAYAKTNEEELSKHRVAAESDFGARKIWRFDTRFTEGALDLAKEMATVLKPLGISRGHNSARGGPDLIPMREKGVPVVTLQQNGWDYFDLHHTADDTFDKINAEEVAQNVASYAAFTWMAANTDEDFRIKPKPQN